MNITCRLSGSSLPVLLYEPPHAKLQSPSVCFPFNWWFCKV